MYEAVVPATLSELHRVAIRRWIATLSSRSVRARLLGLPVLADPPPQAPLPPLPAAVVSQLVAAGIEPEQGAEVWSAAAAQ